MNEFLDRRIIPQNIHDYRSELMEVFGQIFTKSILRSKIVYIDKHIRIILKTKREHFGHLPSQFQYSSKLTLVNKGREG